MVFHGLTLTSKVPLREVCKAIMKYGFATSPYPIIISAEVHCSVPQQDMIAFVMMEEFGKSLLRVPAEGMSKIEALPSPEELKYKILFKVSYRVPWRGCAASILTTLQTKNLTLVHAETLDSDCYFTDLPTSASASASESDYIEVRDVPPERFQDNARWSAEASVKGQFLPLWYRPTQLY